MTRLSASQPVREEHRPVVGRFSIAIVPGPLHARADL